MRRKPYSMLADLLLIGALAVIGLAVVMFARGGWGGASGSASSGQTGALPVARTTAIASTQPVSVTLTIPANATPTLDYAPPTPDPAEPIVDDPGVDRPTPSGPLPAQPTPKPDDPYHMSSCAEREREINQLMSFNPIVIVGRVQEVLPARWTTPDGKRPSNPHATTSDGSIRYGIVTPITIAVEQNIEGQMNDQAITILIGYGVIGQDSVDQCGNADLEQFRVGERVLLFLGGKGRSSVDVNAWGIYDRYTITPQNQAINEFQQLPLSEIIAKIQNAPPLPTAAPL